MKKLIVIWLLFAGLSACNDEGNGNRPFIPNAPVNLTINTDLPSYYHLQTLGGYSLLEGGNRGIFLVHNFDDRYYAIERTCTFHPDEGCGVIQIDTANIQLRCGTYSDGVYSECCESKYSFDGSVLQGPSLWALKHYSVFENGNLLTIRN